MRRDRKRKEFAKQVRVHPNWLFVHFADCTANCNLSEIYLYAFLMTRVSCVVKPNRINWIRWVICVIDQSLCSCPSPSVTVGGLWLRLTCCIVGAVPGDGAGWWRS